jgi:predicted aspartyl protease
MNWIKTLFCAFAIALITSQAEAQNPPGPTTAGRAAMLIASAGDPQHPVAHLGSTVWFLIPPAPSQPATVAVKAEADIPDLKMHATMTLRKNTDPTLQATHTIDLKFSFADGAPIAGFKDVGLPQMRKEDSTAAEALTSVKVKISDTYFLIALAKGESDTARNLDLMQTRSWFDFPLLLNDDRIAKVVFQKSPEGQAMLEKAFEAWRVEAPTSPSLPAKQAPPEQPVLDAGATVVPMVSQGGAFVVPVKINDQMTLNFVVDSGASDVAVPQDVVSTLVRTGTITDADFLGKATYQLADGSKVPSQRFVIRSLKIGDKILEKVVGSISPSAGDPLLGQSFLSRFKSWSIDNQRQVLILGSPPQDIEANAPAATPTDVPIDPHHDAPGMPVSMVSAVDVWLTQSYWKCWTPPPTRPKGGVYVAEIRIILNRDGSLSGSPVLMNPPTDPAWSPHAKSAMLAVKKCDPLRVPTQFLPYFEEWKVETIHFDPREAQN